MMGNAIVFPGRYARGVELRLAAMRSVRLLVGVVPMLLIAGFMEGYVSPSNLPPLLKVSLAVALAAAYLGYLVSCARLPTNAVQERAD